MIDTPVPDFTHLIEERDLADAGTWSEVQNVTIGPGTIREIIFADFPAPAGPQKFYRVKARPPNAPASIAASTLTLTPGDGSGSHLIATDAGGHYQATFNDGSSESGVYAYTPSGDNATLVLTPSNGAGVSNVNLDFVSPLDGTYTSDTVGSGFFNLTSNRP